MMPWVRWFEVWKWLSLPVGYLQLIKGTFSEQVADGIDVYSFPQLWA